MSIGDLLHPEERMLPGDQIAIVAEHASRWYTAHLLLFIGMLLLVPGFLWLTALDREAEAGPGLRGAGADDDWRCWLCRGYQR